MTAYSVLRNKFKEEEYVLISEVPDNVSTRNRYLDFMIINLWASRGLSITGIEQKSNRGDWINELKNPKKQENHFKYCDYFYLLTDKEGVAKLEEIPETWGWYHINDNNILKTMKAAPKLQPFPIPKGLMCGMLRRAQEKKGFVHETAIDSHVEFKIQSSIHAINKQLQENIKKHQDLLDCVNAFETFSGINIKNRWAGNLRGIGEAVDIVRNANIEKHLKTFKYIGECADSLQADVLKHIQELQKFVVEQKDNKE